MPRTSSVSEKVWAQAIHAVTVQKMSLRRAAQLYGVHHMSLHRRVRGRYVGPATARFADEFQLSRAEEHEAVSVLREQFDHERSVTSDDVRYVVRTIACHGARHDVPADFPQSRWIANFRRQHGFSTSGTTTSRGSSDGNDTRAAVSQPQPQPRAQLQTPEAHLARTDSNVSTRTDTSNTSTDSNTSNSSNYSNNGSGGMYTSSHGNNTASRDLRDLSHAASLTYRDNGHTQTHMRRSDSQRSNSSSRSMDVTANYNNNSSDSNSTAQSAPRAMFARHTIPLAPQLQSTPQQHHHDAAHRQSTRFEPLSRPRTADRRTKGDDQRTDTSESESESSRHVARTKRSTSSHHQHYAPSMRSLASGNSDDTDAKTSASQQQHVAAADVSAETWERAMDAVEIHGMSLRNAAKAYGVHFAALHRRVKKRALLQQSAPPLENYVPFEDEAGIVRVVHARADLGLLMSYDELVELLQRTALKHAPTLSIEFSYALVRRFQSRVEQSIRHLVTDWPLPRLESLNHFHPPGVQGGSDIGTRPRDSVHSVPNVSSVSSVHSVHVATGGRSDDAMMRTMLTPTGDYTNNPNTLTTPSAFGSSSSLLDARDHDFPSDDAHTPRPRLSVPFVRPLYRSNSSMSSNSNSNSNSNVRTTINDVHMSSPNAILRL